MFDRVKDLLKNNIQVNQTIGLSIILFLGIQFFGLKLSYLEVLIIFSSVILFDLVFIKYETGKYNFPFSGVNSGFGISFFLRTDDIIIYIFVGFLAILLKRLITIGINKDKKQCRHFLNPSNAAVFLTLILFPIVTWTNPLQWNQGVGINTYFLLLFLIIILGINIEWKLKNIVKIHYFDVIFSVLITHIFLFLLITKETLDSALLFFNGAFFIFIFFQVTDPKTIPEKRLSRILYGIAIALMFYLLQYFINENYALLGSLFFMTLFLPLIWNYDFKKINSFFTKSDIFLLTLIILMIILLGILINYYGIPDLVFNNRCNQLICK